MVNFVKCAQEVGGACMTKRYNVMIPISNTPCTYISRMLSRSCSYMVLKAHAKGNSVPSTLTCSEPRTEESEMRKQHIIIASATIIMCCLCHSDSSAPGSEYLRPRHHL